MLLNNLVSQEICDFITDAMLRASNIEGNMCDDQVKKTLTFIYGDLYLETMHEILWPIIEQAYGEELLPTYTYARLYTNGNILEPHIDRPACEVSVTLQLGKSHSYQWPIFIEGKEYQMNVGSGVIYHGHNQEHWRDACAGPEGYYSGQVFFHFVRKNGPFANFFGNERPNPEKLYSKNRRINAL